MHNPCSVIFPRDMKSGGCSTIFTLFFLEKEERKIEADLYYEKKELPSMEADLH